MLTYSNMFEHELRTLLATRIVELNSHLGNPGVVTSWEDYKTRVGVIAGLRAALEFCDQAAEICAKQ